MDRIVSETVSAGATLRAGGSHEGLLYRPTVLGNVTPSMAAFREEIFGPVAPVIVVKDADEAVRVANDTEYGLVAAGRVHPVAVGHLTAARARLPVLKDLTGPLPATPQRRRRGAAVPAASRAVRHDEQALAPPGVWRLASVACFLSLLTIFSPSYRF